MSNTRLPRCTFTHTFECSFRLSQLLLWLSSLLLNKFFARSFIPFIFLANLPHRYGQLKYAVGETIFSKLQEVKVLVIGAGGIGCELLKNLVLTGFHDIEIVISTLIKACSLFYELFS